MKLGDIAKVHGGYAFKSSKFEETGVPIIRIGNLDGEIVNIDSIICYPTEFIEKHPEFLINKGDILVAMSGATVGKIGMYVNDENALLNQRVGNIRPIGDIDRRLLYYYCKSSSFKRLIIKEAFGCAQPNISSKKLEAFEVLLPDKSQHKVVIGILDKISRIIESKKRQLLDYDQLIKSRFVEMFKGCRKCTLSKLAKITMGQSPKSSTYNYQGIGLPFYQGKTEFTDKYVLTRKYCSEPKKTAELDDVLMSVRAPVGSVNITRDKACIGRGLAAIRGKRDLATNEFLFYALKAIEQEVSSMGQGSTFKAINKQQLYNVQIPDADLSKQDEFVLLSKHIDKLKFEVQKSLDETQILFDSLMQEYFG